MGVMQEAHANELSSRITECAEAMAQRDVEARRAQRLKADAEEEIARAKKECDGHVSQLTGELKAVRLELEQQKLAVQQAEDGTTQLASELREAQQRGQTGSEQEHRSGQPSGAHVLLVRS